MLLTFSAEKLSHGIELNTKADDIPIELLGYNIDYNKMNELCNKIYLPTSERNKSEFTRLIQKCKDYGIILDDDIEEKFDKNDFASVAIRNSIINHEENKSKINERSWNSTRDFYRDYMSNPSTPLYVEMKDLVPDINTVIDAVKEAGGLVFVPHIFEYRTNSPKVIKFLLNNGRIDGFECYYTTFTNEQHDFVVNLCKEKGFLMSGGCDYHGTRKPDTFIGTGHGEMAIPDEICLNWIKPLN